MRVVPGEEFTNGIGSEAQILTYTKAKLKFYLNIQILNTQSFTHFSALKYPLSERTIKR